MTLLIDDVILLSSLAMVEGVFRDGEGLDQTVGINSGNIEDIHVINR